MPITIDAKTFQPVTPAQAPATPLPVTPVVLRESTRRDQNSKNDRKDTALKFRAVLDAAVMGKLTDVDPVAAAGTEAPERPSKLPKTGPTELSGGESAGLLGAAQTTRGVAAAPDNSRPYRAATSRYAQAFFADTRTFARPGESLELTA